MMAIEKCCKRLDIGMQMWLTIALQMLSRRLLREADVDGRSQHCNQGSTLVLSELLILTAVVTRFLSQIRSLATVSKEKRPCPQPPCATASSPFL